MDIHNRIVFTLKKEVSSGLGYSRNVNHEDPAARKKSVQKDKYWMLSFV